VAKLPYLEGLGINAIELMPVASFPGERSWGYNPAHPFAVAARYGGPDELHALVRAAHARGIAVLVDVVYNHFGPDGLSLWRFDGWHENGSGGIYFYNDWRSKTPWGHTRPDYGRPEVRRFVRDNVFMWLETYGVDGLRWDATSWIRNAHGHDGDPGADIGEAWQMMQDINREMEQRFPARLRIAEDMQDNAWLVKEATAGGAGFDAQWDASFVHVVREAIIGARDEARDVAAVAAAIRGDGLESPWQRVIFTESHDEVANGQARVPEEIAPGDAGHRFARQRAALGAGLVFTAPGIPMLFQGQEFLMPDWFDDNVPLAWAKAEENQGTLRFYQDLIRLRRNLDGVSRGLQGSNVNVFHVNDEAKLIAIHRWDKGGAGDDVIVIANFANQTVAECTLGLPREGVWHVRLNSALRRYGAGMVEENAVEVVATAVVEGETTMGMPFAAALSVTPYTLIVLSQG
jgi:1,4-alpha-glucan branching enzyme